MSKKLPPRKNKKGELVFYDYPQFIPNLTPKEMFQRGSFGGTYWRPIYSSVTGEYYENMHLIYPKSWWKGLEDSFLVTPFDQYDKSVNTYKVKVGSTLQEWEEKQWIRPSHPYGWVQWYCSFYRGERSEDDEWQIQRWIRTAGPKSRFRLALINEIKRKNTTYNDFSISPARRQTLQHWGYVLTHHDMKDS